MELRTLRSFLAVTREGNVTRAARRLHVSQPALSRQLSDLEKEFGCQLLVREARGVTLTEEGMLLRKRAEEIVGLAERTEQEMRTPTAELEGDVWVGGGESRGMGIVAQAAARLTDRHPGVRLRLYSANAVDVIERVDKGLLDFGVIMGSDRPGGRFETLVLPWSDRWGVLMRADDSLARHASLTFDDLCGLPLIMSAQIASPSQATVAQPINMLGRGDLTVVATYTLLYNASLLVEQGLGVAVCFDGIVASGPGTPFAFVPLEGVDSVPSHLVWKRHQPLTRAASTLLDELRQLM